MDRLVIQARKASRDPKDCLSTIASLRAIGFGDAAFSMLHHQHGSRAVFYGYCENHQRFVEDGNNHRVHQRLKYVDSSCPGGAPPKGKSFESLAEEAFRLIPPSK